MTHRMLSIFVWTLLLVLLGSTGYAGCSGCVRGCGASYSDGERGGVIVKFSRKGVLYKSWEGTMNLGGTRAAPNGGVTADTFNFYVPDGPMVESVKAAEMEGKRVTLHYQQWLVSPISQDSDYTITSVYVY